MQQQKNDKAEPSARITRPPGLRGKEIGMFYRQQRKNQKKNENTEPKIRLGSSVTVPSEVLERVEICLQRFKNAPIEQQVDANCERKFHHLLRVNFNEFIAETQQQHKGTDNTNSDMDKALQEKFQLRLNNPQQRARYEERLKLPAMHHATEIVAAVQQHQVILIVGSTGCGKTTQVPQLLLDDCLANGTASSCRIICTQPRRISAITVAERVSYERNECLGQSVGYQIRLESCRPRERGSITYCTTGLLLQQMQKDPLLHNASVLILDEIHERTVETDMLMALLKQILPYRPTLKIILMSATVREQVFCDYFDKCPMFRIDGVMFPVETFYLEDILTMTGYQFKPQTQRRARNSRHDERQQYKAMIEPYIRRVRNNYNDRVLQMLRLPESEGCENIDFVADLIYYICETKRDGAILVFMPGFERISQLCTLLDKPNTPKGLNWRNHLLVYPLHSMLPTSDQQSVFRRAPAGKRKVIISTILAETSVTIDDVVYVINTGRYKSSSFDSESNIKMLAEQWVSKANTQQRKGRAGRVQPGVCYNLFTRAREALMKEVPTPEIIDAKMESILLSLKLLHIGDPYRFLETLIDAPQPEAISKGVALLRRIEAFDEGGQLTPLGMHLAYLPIDPQIGKMILMAALFRCLDPISSAAAVLSYKTPFYTPVGQEARADEAKRRLSENMRSDHLLVHTTIVRFRECHRQHRQQRFCHENFVSSTTLLQLERMKQQFSELLKNCRFLTSANCRHDASNINSEKTTLLRAIIGAGLYPNMAHLRKSRKYSNRVRAIHQMSSDDGRRVNFHPSSVNSGEMGFESGYFVYYQRQKSNDLYLLDSSMVFPMSLIIFGDGVEAGVYDNTHYISVAKTYYFKCNPETAAVVLELRQHLARLLLKKALYPAPIEQHSDEEQLIKAIELLLSIDDQADDSISSDEAADVQPV